MDTNCPICESGELTSYEYSDEFRHGEESIRVNGLEAMRCSTCGEEVIFPDQARRNHARVVDAKRTFDGLMTGDAVRELRQRLSLTQQDASRIFGGGTNAFSKYERGDVSQSVAMDRLLRIASAFPFVVSYLRWISGEASDLLSPTYEGGQVVSMNEDEFSARQLKGKVVQVNRSDWSEQEKDCA